MNVRRRFLPAGALSVLALWASVPALAASAWRGNLVPYPEKVLPLDGAFEPRGGLRVVLSQPANRELHELGELAAEMLRDRFGLHPTLVPQGAGASLGPALRLSLVALGRGASAEAYVLEVTSSGMALSAPSPAGIFYGLQTLRQILSDAGANPSIPAVRIEDSPRFAYRGMRLDTTGERLPVAVIERWIDLAARYKLNALRWRLTGPSAWRLEVLRYPLLAGASRDEIYSQEDVRRIVDYARDRQVAIVPEIDLVHLGGAAHAAYPETACKADSACPPAQAVELAADVAGELVELFPGRLLDLSGDRGFPDPESSQRLTSVLAARGRELATAGEPPSGAGSSGLLLLRGDPTAAAAAARDGFDVIVTGVAVSVAGAQILDPAAGLDESRAHRLRGVEIAAPPAAGGERGLMAIAETLWSPNAKRDAADLAQRLEVRARDETTAGGVAASAPTPP